MERRTAVLVDPHPLWLDAVTQVVEQVGFTVVATARTFPEGAALVEHHDPDLLVAEIYGDDLVDGTSWLVEVGGLSSGLKSIVLSLCADDDRIERAFRAGALAYVLKTADPDNLAAVIGHVFDESIYLPRMRDVSAPMLPPESRAVEDLTRRELEILRLVAEGHSNAKLAKMLWVTEQTVKFHLSNIYRKLDVSNRTEASRWAQVHGLLPVDRLEEVGAA
jgi:two-component system, NarL family, response regulator DevR